MHRPLDTETLSGRSYNLDDWEVITVQSGSDAIIVTTDHHTATADLTSFSRISPYAPVSDTEYIGH